MKLDPIEAVIDDIRLGKMVVLIDDADRENEGDLVVAAEKVTPEILTFMMHEGRGLICLALSEERIRELQIAMQVRENTSAFGTNFTVSIDHKSVSDCGVSASARAKTILATVADDARAEDFVSPGFVYPLAAVPGGVLKRRGQTEGSVDLSRLAGLKSAGVVCEIMGEDGRMLRGAALDAFCKQHQLKISSVEALKQYRLRNEVCLRRVAESPLANFGRLNLADFAGKLRVLVYVDDVDNEEQLAFVCGNPTDGCLVRIHSECLTGDVFGSQRCDCGDQLSRALSRIMAEGAGVILYLHQEGRGIGLANKVRAYALQDQGVDTVDANLQLGFGADLRDYRAGAQILCDLGIKSVRLLTNNPKKVQALESFGIRVIDRQPLVSTVDEHNAEYLKTKRDRMGHLLPNQAFVDSDLKAAAKR